MGLSQIPFHTQDPGHYQRLSARIHSIVKIVGRTLIQFVIPLVLIVPIIVGAEQLAELFGFHGSGTQFVRFILFGVYALLVFSLINKKKT